MALTLDTLKFGDLNTIKENDDNHAGDRRRTSPLTALRFATEKAFEKDTLIGVSEFVGVVVGKRQIDFATHEYQGTLINTSLLPKPEPEGSPPRGTKNMLYRVYIPELEPLPAPKSYSDPVLLAYKEIPIDIETAPANLQLIEGDVVKVRYQDANNLFGPKIIKKVSGATPEWDIQPVGDVQRQRSQSTSPQRSSPTPQEPTPPYVPSTTPTTPARARQASGTTGTQEGIIWIPTGQRVYNGRLQKSSAARKAIGAPYIDGILEKVKLGYSKGGRKINVPFWALAVCIPDYLEMERAYNEVFNGTKYIGVDFMACAGFYRPYWRQKQMYDGKPGPGAAAFPGSSNHGLGLAFDMSSNDMMCGSGYKPFNKWGGGIGWTKAMCLTWADDIRIAWGQTYPGGRRLIGKPGPTNAQILAGRGPNKAWTKNPKGRGAKETGGSSIELEIDFVLKAQSIKWRWLNRYGNDDHNFVLTVTKEAWHFDWKKRPDYFRMDESMTITHPLAKDYKKKKKGDLMYNKVPKSRINATPKRSAKPQGVSVLKIGPKDKPWEGAEWGVGPFGGDPRPHVRPDPKPSTGRGSGDRD